MRLNILFWKWNIYTAALFSRSGVFSESRLSYNERCSGIFGHFVQLAVVFWLVFVCTCRIFDNLSLCVSIYALRETGEQTSRASFYSSDSRKCAHSPE